MTEDPANKEKHVATTGKDSAHAGNGILWLVVGAIAIMFVAILIPVLLQVHINQERDAQTQTNSSAAAALEQTALH